ncbi:hypothetical protein V8E54_004146 [Elaphomyces granulatus]
MRNAPSLPAPPPLRSHINRSTSRGSDTTIVTTPAFFIRNLELVHLEHQNIFDSTPAVPPCQINPNSDPDVKIAYLLECVFSAGFDSLDEAYATYLTTGFPPGHCQRAQTKSWVMGGVRDVIVKAGDCELSGLGKIKEDFKIGIYTVSQKLYQQEFTESQVSRQGQRPFLNVATTDVTDELLTQDTIGKLKGLFTEKINQRVKQERIDSHNTFFCGTLGFWAESIIPPGHALPLRASLNPTRAKNMTSKDTVPVTAIDEEFNKDVTIPGRYEIEGIIVNLR